MEKKSTLFLRLAVIAIGIPVLAICILGLPQIALIAFEQFHQGGRTLATIVFGILFIMYVSGIPFYFALYQAWKLLSYIDNNQAFSQISVVALNKIKYCAKCGQPRPADKPFCGHCGAQG